MRYSFAYQGKFNGIYCGVHSRMQVVSMLELPEEWSSASTSRRNSRSPQQDSSSKPARSSGSHSAAR